MSRRQRHNNDSPAPALHFSGAHNRVFRVVSALHDHIGTKKLNEIERRVVRKNYNEIDAFEAGHDIASFSVRAYWAIWAFQSPYGLIAVDSDDQCIGGLSGRRENVDVPGMEKVEHAVGECDLSFLCRAPAFRIDPRRDFAGRIAWLQSLLAATGWKCSTCSFLNGSLITSS